MTQHLPEISIVTPSFNQAQFLEECMQSVLDSNYPNLEYIVIDGNSTDGSVEVIQRHAHRLKYWTSEPDAGQYDALQKGFRHATGEVLGWLNSDDKYSPWALPVVGEIFAQHPEIAWLTSMFPLVWDERGRATSCAYTGGFHRDSFRRGANLKAGKWFARSWIQQESTFWRRSLWERAGGHLDSDLKFAGDFELWMRFFDHGGLYGVATPLGGFRRHSGQKTASLDGYLAEAETVLRKHGCRPYGVMASGLRQFLHTAVGGRPMKRLSPGVAGLAVRCGLLHPVPICVFEDGVWKVVTDYVV